METSVPIASSVTASGPAHGFTAPGCSSCARESKERVGGRIRARGGGIDDEDAAGSDRAQRPQARARAQPLRA